MRVTHDVGYLLIAFVIAHHPEIGLRTQAIWVSFSERGWVNLCERSTLGQSSERGWVNLIARRRIDPGPLAPGSDQS